MALTKITSDVIGTGAVTSDHLASGAVTHSSLSSITTDNVSEGSTNIYFTNARARGSVSVTGGNLSYDSGTGVIQLTTDQIRTAVSGGTGVSISAGEISIGQDVATSSTPTFGDITTTGYIAGPATFTIDPAAVGDNTGTVVIAGNLQVDGTTTTINSTTLEVDDLNITLASGAANAAAANGAGITVDGASATITYDGTNDEWDFNKPINLTGDDHDLLINSADYELVLLGNRGSTGVNLDKAYLRMKAEGTNTVVIDTAGNSYFNGGNVGIGTDNPGFPLHINSSSTDVAKFQTSGSYAYTRFQNSSKTWALSVGSSFSFYDEAASDTRMVIDSSGKVGIGITPTEGKLHVKSDGAGEVELLTLENSTGTNGKTTLTFKTTSTDATKSAQIFAERINASGHTDLAFRTFNGSTTEAVRIDHDGKVAIGSTSDALDNMSGLFRILDSTGGDRTVAHFGAHNYGDTGKTFINIGTEYTDGTSRIGSFNDAGNKSVLVFDTHSASSGQFEERMRIDSSGNVGIGTNSPDTYQYSSADRNLVIEAANGARLVLLGDSGNTGDSGEEDSSIYMMSDGGVGTDPFGNSSSYAFGYALKNINYSGLQDFNITEWRNTNEGWNSRIYIQGQSGGGASFVFNGGTSGATVATNDFATPTSDFEIRTTGSMTVPKGTTAERPSGSYSGRIRFNTTLEKLEQYNGTVWRILTTAYTIDYLILGGGGSGGDCTSPARFGGGGGAGGLRTSYGTVSGRASSAENPLEVQPENTLTITVGAGAAGGVTADDTAGTQGNSSSISGGNFTTVTSLGGGGGGGNSAPATSGGCGGGGSESTGTGGAGTSGQGFNGGTGSEAADRGGGGGGTGAVGGSTDGGAGTSVSITGSAVTYGGGGASSGSGGSGGGGTGSTNGTANLGGGGGAAGTITGAGGSGVVILRMATADYSGVTTGSPTVTTSGSDTILKFTSSGTYTT